MVFEGSSLEKVSRQEIIFTLKVSEKLQIIIKEGTGICSPSTHPAITAMSTTPPLSMMSATTFSPHDGFEPYEAYDPYVPDDHKPDYSGEMIRYYLVWVILGIGVPSNLIAIIVVSCSRRLRETPSGVLLLALTIVDTVVLVCTRLTTLTVSEGLGDKWVHMGDAVLKALFYMTYSGRCAASFIVAAISINRFAVTVFPLRSDWFKQTSSALIQVGIAAVLALLANVFIIFYPPLVTNYCDHCYFVGILFVEILLTDVIISIGILILSGLTIRALWKSRQLMAELQMDDQASQRRNRQATVLLLVVAITYVVLRLQYKVVWVPVFVMEYLTGTGLAGFPTSLRNAYYVTYCIFLLNFATNLYQYCLCLQEFRSEACRLLCPKPVRRRIKWFAASLNSSSSSSQKVEATMATAV